MLNNNPDNLRNKEIDLLRAYAVLCVWILHCCLLVNSGFGYDIPIKDYINLETGVDIFFVISGYVVSDSLYRISLSTDMIFFVFIKKRIKRLWLAASFWLLICLVLGLLLQGTSDWPVPSRLMQQFLSGLVYLFNFQEFMRPTALGYFWSLSVEFQFYLLLPALFLLSKTVRSFAFLVLLVIGCFSRAGGDTWWMFRYDGILVGIMVWDFRKEISAVFKKTNEKFLKLFFISIFALILTIELKIDYFFVGKVLVALLAGLLVGLAATQRGAVYGFGLNEVINWIGLRSYSIYLAHIPMSMLLISIFQNYHLSNLLVFIILEIFIVLISSELSYRYLECYKWPVRAKKEQAAITH